MIEKIVLFPCQRDTHGTMLTSMPEHLKTPWFHNATPTVLFSSLRRHLVRGPNLARHFVGGGAYRGGEHQHGCGDLVTHRVADKRVNFWVYRFANIREASMDVGKSEFDKNKHGATHTYSMADLVRAMIVASEKSAKVARILR
jgi:hypothetical protein